MCPRLPPASWPTASFFNVSVGFFLIFLSKQTNNCFLTHHPCLSTSFSLCTPSKLPPDSYTGFLNTIYSIDFWALFCISTSNKDRLVTQCIIFSKCWRAYLNKLHGNVHIAHLLKGIFFLERYYPELQDAHTNKGRKQASMLLENCILLESLDRNRETSPPNIYPTEDPFLW